MSAQRGEKGLDFLIDFRSIADDAADLLAQEFPVAAALAMNGDPNGADA